MSEKKVLVIFGTRPEVIKMAPIVHALRESQLGVVTCATAQHRHLLDQPLEFFGIKPDYDLNLMRENQDLFDVTSSCLLKLREVMKEVSPEIVLVQGDTTTALTAALAAYYLRIRIGHVEAGLRTGNKLSPFPEEGNRHLIAAIADLHFAPTSGAAQNLKHENVSENVIIQTGNTGIDALLWAKSRAIVRNDIRASYAGKKLILLTAHRRESFGEPMREIFSAIRDFVRERPDFHVVYPVHPNPSVQTAANEVLQGLGNLTMVPPVSYGELVQLLLDSQFVMTDSGGIQEEAPTLGKPVLVLRETTERPEAVTAGCARLVGHDRTRILEQMRLLADISSPDYQSMVRAVNPFGDGTAAAQIVRHLEERLLPRMSRAA